MDNKMLISLNTIEKIKDFVEIVKDVPCDLDLIKGRRICDGKSILGILSFDVSKPLELIVHSDSEELVKELFTQIRKYEVFE